ncbi:MAG: hypothetical protein ACKERG_04520 [Candidatus Hodgkinia cicadicola]
MQHWSDVVVIADAEDVWPDGGEVTTGLRVLKRDEGGVWDEEEVGELKCEL